MLVRWFFLKVRSEFQTVKNNCFLPAMRLFLNYSQNIFTCIPQNTRETAIIPFQTELKLYTYTRKYTRHRTSKKTQAMCEKT